MDEERSFGEIAAKNFRVGDIVEWTTWDSYIEEWEPHYGILASLKNELRSNRLVSISKVLPLNRAAAMYRFLNSPAYVVVIVVAIFFYFLFN